MDMLRRNGPGHKPWSQSSRSKRMSRVERICGTGRSWAWSETTMEWWLVRVVSEVGLNVFVKHFTVNRLWPYLSSNPHFEEWNDIMTYIWFSALWCRDRDRRDWWFQSYACGQKTNKQTNMLIIICYSTLHGRSNKLFSTCRNRSDERKPIATRLK